MAIFVAAFGVALSGALSPGPLLTVTIAESARGGAWTGPKLIAGHAVLELALVLALLFGARAFFDETAFLLAISAFGAVFLVWMGLSLLARVRRHEAAPWPDQETAKPGLSPFVLGILASLANPYWTLWWITIGVGLLLPALSLGGTGFAAFFAGHIGADFLWYTLVSSAVARGRRILSETFYRRLMTGCGLFLLGLAAYFTYAAVGFGHRLVPR